MRNPRAGTCLALAALLLASRGSLTPAADNTDSLAWRGDGSGRYCAAAPPSAWSPEDRKNIAWWANVGKSPSSPIVVGSRVFVTTEPDRLLCVDRRSGKRLWEQTCSPAELPAAEAAKVVRLAPAGYLAPTPVSDGQRVFVALTSGIVACYDLSGRRQWIRYVEASPAPEHGRGASPVLVDGRLIVHLGSLVALNPSSGEVLWQNDEARPSYGTPVAASIGPQGILVTPHGDIVRTFDGKLLASEICQLEHTSPIIDNGVMYFIEGTATALKLPAEPADVIAPEELWTQDLEGQFFASPVLDDGLIYTIDNNSHYRVLDAVTGNTVLDKELELPAVREALVEQDDGELPPGPMIYPSVTLAGKQVYLSNDAGNTFVLAAGREYREIARNTLGSGSAASPVVAGREIFLRGGELLYAVRLK